MTWLLLTLAGALLALMLVLVGVAAWWNWSTTLEQERQTARGVARLVSNQTARMVEAADLVLRQMTDLAAVTDWSDPAAVQATTDKLHEYASLLPYTDALFIFDVEGRARAATLDRPESDQSVRDRQYFQIHREDPEAGLYVSRVLTGRVTDTRFFALTRGVSDEEGDFAGVVSFTVNPEALRHFYRRLDIPYDAVFLLVGRDMTLLAREPLLQSALGQPVGPQLRQALTEHSLGTVDFQLEGDNERVWAYQKVSDYPLFVVIGISKYAIFELWRYLTLPYLLLTLVTLAGFLGMTLFAVRRARNEDRYRWALARANVALEHRVAERTSELEALLRQRETLVREVHHRVKNNLQVISSLLTIQARAVGSELEPYFEESIRRIAAMGQIHQMLYSAENVAGLDLGQYLEALCADLVGSYGAADRVRCEIAGESLTLDLDAATPLALILSEAISNALKHGFPGGRQGIITVRLHRADGRVILHVHDNGLGIREELKTANPRTMGMKLMETLARQLDGDLRVFPDAGTTVEVAFPERAVPGATDERPQST